MLPAIPPPRRCRGTIGNVPSAQCTVRFEVGRKVLFDSWQQVLGYRLGHRVTQDDTMAFLLWCAEFAGDVVVDAFVGEHFSRADHGDPASVGVGA